MFIRIRTILVIVLTTSIIILFSVFAGITTTKRGIDRSEESALMLIADIADHFISSAIEVLKLKGAELARSLSVADEAGWPAILANQETSEFIGIAVINSDRRLVASSGELPAPPDIINDKFISQAFHGNKRFSSTIPTESHGVVFYLAVPIPGAVNNILVLTLPGMYFSELVSTFVVWETGHIFIDDAEGHIIANRRAEWVQTRINFLRLAETDPEYEEQAVVLRRVMGGEAGVGNFSVFGVPRLCAFRPITGSEEGWFLGAVAPIPESPFGDINRGLIVVGLVGFFLCVIAAVIASSFVKKPFDQITALKESAQEASRAKSNFLANMSHEMRTPLTAVLGLTELTLETTQLDDETYSNLLKVYRAGETLLFLINDILDISKIEAEKLELHPLEYDLPSLLNDTITQSILYVGEKPVEFVLNINDDLPNYLFGDELRIKQILNNFLSNAFKFTHEGTVELGVRCDREGDDVWLEAWVRDTGIGIRPEDIEKLFTVYSRLEEDTKGTGLGLSISKRVAEIMDGSIKVESEYGKGSVFTVKLRQKYVNEAVIGSEVVENLKNFHYSINKYENAKMTRINLSYARVLVVDDNPTNLDVAKGLLNLYGMKVDCVTGGQPAIDIIRDEKVRYNAIFMDHMMPGMNGIEATRIIREEINTDYAETVPIIALTANAIVGNAELFLKQGFQAFISKPIDFTHLDVVLRKWVRDKNAEALLPDKIIRTEGRQGKGVRKFKETIPGLDTDKGIARFGFSEEMYLDVLRSYAKNTIPLLDAIKEVEIDDLNEYAVIVHGIKGSSRGIFAEIAGNKAEALENAAKGGDRDFLRANNQDLIETVSELIADIEDALVKHGTESKPVRDKPDRELLSRLRQACESYDIDEIDAVMSEIEGCEYKSDDGFTARLRENVDQGKYKNIIEMITAFP